MALWMTVEQEFLGLAAVLFVFSCALAHFGVLGKGRGRHRRSVFFACLTISLGCVIGVLRMETEQSVIRREMAMVKSVGEQEVDVEGVVLDIGETEFGHRLILKVCAAGEGRIRRVYVYVPSAEGIKLGQRILVRGMLELPEPDRNPGQFDFQLYCLAKGICGTMSGEVAAVVDSDYFGVQEILRQAGLLLERRLEQIAAEEDLGILKAVLLGEKRDMDDEVYKLYQKNGISHVLAISGLHVSVIGMGLWNGLRKIGAGYVGAGFAAFGMLFCFGSIAGFGPSVIRAVFMMGISFVAGIFGRTYDLPSAMCVPGIGILLWNPYMLTQASFQLSFLAVFAIFFPGAYLAKAWKLQGVVQNVWTSVSIQLVTLPVVLYHSFEVPMFGLVLNVFVVPLMTYVLVSGILGLLGSFLWLPLGMFLLGGAHYILALYRYVCELMETISVAYLILGRPSFGAIGAYFTCLFAGTWICAGKKIGVLFWLVGALALVPMAEPGLSVTFLDVGQGDGIFMEVDGKTLLVDCGSSQEKTLGEDCLVPLLKSQGIRYVDVVAVTHGDLDHISGVRYLLEHAECGIDIGQLVMPVSGLGDRACEELEALAEARGIPVWYMRDGTVLCGRGGEKKPESLAWEVGKKVPVQVPEEQFWRALTGEKIKIDCLHPGENMVGAGTDRNDGSLVLRLGYGRFSMLLTGDVEKTGEMQILQRGGAEAVTVLKAAHHGSATSTGMELLDVMAPDYVVFSYGAGNRYGHPAADVVERCEESGAEIWKTAESGAITVWTDGRNMEISGWLDRQNGI